MMKTVVEWFRLHLLAAFTATGLLSAGGGAILSDFASWRTANRDFVKAQVEAAQKADHDLIDILRKFSNMALGKASTTEDDLKVLQAGVTKSYMVAATLSARFPSVKSDFDQYADALFTLQKSAEKLTGPADAQSFVEAVSAFADKRKTFEQRVASLQTSWPL
jgi:hypothetical protein